MVLLCIISLLGFLIRSVVLVLMCDVASGMYVIAIGTCDYLLENGISGLNTICVEMYATTLCPCEIMAGFS